jgi:pSer/pThr/pTyr-binding forkhead associated (FHA) protein
MPAIVVQLAGVTSVFYDRFVIGTRSDCDLVLYDQDASPMHALVTPEETGWRVEDMGSLRGVRVNGRMRATARLEKGDRVRLAGTTLVMVPVGESGPASSPH